MKQPTLPTEILRNDIFNISFFAHAPFFGSFREMHYRIQRFQNDDVEKHLELTTWPGPFIFEKTPDEQKQTATFPFSNEGLDQVTAYLNSFYQSHF